MSTAVARVPTQTPNTPPPYPIYKMSVEQYHRMIEAGILDEEDDVELLEGWAVPKMSRKPPHDVSIAMTLSLLARLLGLGWHTRGQSAITLADSEPEPDVAIVRGDFRDYVSHHPLADEVGLVMEVSDTTLSDDRKNKGRIYARAGIPIYWIVNLVDEQVEVFSEPDPLATPPRYQQRQDYKRGQHVPLILPGQSAGQILVTDILP